MNILITGGAGFIGCNFVRMMIDKYPDYEIKVLDNLSYSASLDNLKDVLDKIEFIKGDITNKKDVENSLKNVDAVIHFAAESIPENIYIPIQSTPKTGTRMVTFGELWKEQSRKNKPQKTEKGEVIFFKGKQVKALSFLNGGQWMPIKAVTRHWYKGKIIKLKQKWGIIEATPNHSIYSANLELTNPETNPELLVVREVNKIRKKYKMVNKNLLKILAAYITEGNATFNKANGGYIVGISQGDKEWIKEIGEAIKEEFNLTYCIIKHKKKPYQDVYSLQVSNQKFFNYLIKNCGKYCDGKFFPNWIFDLEPEQREFFWQKLVEGDGTKDYRYSTTSYKLANQISLLLALQGKKFRVFEYDRKKYKRNWEFKTSLSGQHYGLNQKEKIEIDYEGWVYDLEIEKTHNFVCGIGNVVCHNSHVDNSIKNPEKFVKTNVFGTYIMLECARNNEVDKFLHISTDETYGSIEDGSFKESDLLNPASPYSASKAGSDLLVNAYHTTYGLNTLITRSSNNFGPYQYPEKLIPVLIKNAIYNNPLPIYGDGLNVRDWIFVEDNCNGIDIVFHKGKNGEIYNIGGGNEKTNLEIAKLILKELNKSEELITFIKDRLGHDRRYSIDITKIKALGWKPILKFEDALTYTVKWYLENKWFWDK